MKMIKEMPAHQKEELLVRYQDLLKLNDFKNKFLWKNMKNMI